FDFNLLFLFVVFCSFFFFFFSSRRRHTRFDCDWSSDVCSSDLQVELPSQVPEGRSGTEIPPFSAQGPSRSLGEELEEFVGGAERSEERRVGKECRSRWSRDD